MNTEDDASKKHSTNSVSKQKWLNLQNRTKKKKAGGVLENETKQSKTKQNQRGTQTFERPTLLSLYSGLPFNLFLKD